MAAGQYRVPVGYNRGGTFTLLFGFQDPQQPGAPHPTSKMRRRECSLQFPPTTDAWACWGAWELSRDANPEEEVRACNTKIVAIPILVIAESVYLKGNLARQIWEWDVGC